MAIYIVKMGFGRAPRRCEIHSKPQSLMQKTFLSRAFETLLHAQTLVCVRRLLGCVCRFMPAYAGLGFLLAFIFQK